MFLFLLSSMHLLQNLCGFWTHASPFLPLLLLLSPSSSSSLCSLTPSLSLSLPLLPLKCPPWEKRERERRGKKKRKCEHQQKNGCLASCIIFRNKQCETVLASLLAYIHKDRVCVPVSKIKGKHKKSERYSPLPVTEVSQRDSALGKHVIATDPISANKGDKQWSWVNCIACVCVCVCVHCNVGVHWYYNVPCCS